MINETSTGVLLYAQPVETIYRVPAASRIIATAMQKGGVGKTTTTLALGSELARGGARVLLVDLDPQSNLTQGLGYDPTSLNCSIYEAMIDPAQAREAMLHTPSNSPASGGRGVDLLPATLALAGAELAFAGRFGRELLLRNALAPLRGDYDYILIDSPPSLGLFTVNALTTADTVLVPLQAHVFALGAMAQLEDTISMIRQLNPSLEIGGIVVTMIDRRTSVNALVESEARVRYGELVFQATIPLNTKITEAPAAGVPVTVYAADSAGARAYRALAEEVRQRWPIPEVRDET